MTCEIAVMNREAIALAADSAETVFGGKFFPSAEKFFSNWNYNKYRKNKSDSHRSERLTGA